MDIEFWNLIFKTGLTALLSFSIPFIFMVLTWVTTNLEIGVKTTKKEWLIISLISLFIMTVVLLIFGIAITK